MSTDEIERLRLEIEILESHLADSARLAHGWMKKHDRVLAFVQQHPRLLPELADFLAARDHYDDQHQEADRD